MVVPTLSRWHPRAERPSSMIAGGRDAVDGIVSPAFIALFGGGDWSPPGLRHVAALCAASLAVHQVPLAGLPQWPSAA